MDDRRSSTSHEKATPILSNKELAQKVKDLLRSNNKGNSGRYSRSIDRIITGNENKSMTAKQQISTNPYQSLQEKKVGLLGTQSGHHSGTHSREELNILEVKDNNWMSAD